MIFQLNNYNIYPACRLTISAGGLHTGRRQSRQAGDPLCDRPRICQRDLRQQQEDRAAQIRPSSGEGCSQIRIQLQRICFAARSKQR